MTVSRQVLVPYDELEIRLIEAVAAVAAPVLASAQRQSDGVRRQQGATELSRLAGSLTQSLSARTVGERLVQAIIPLVHGVDAAFWDATGRLTIPGSGPLALLREPCDPRVERVVELVRSAEHRFWTPDLTNDRRLAQPESSHAEEPPEPHGGRRGARPGANFRRPASMAALHLARRGCVGPSTRRVGRLPARSRP